MIPIGDVHCDLLHYLCKNPQRSANDLIVRCSIPQLHAGFVKIQVLAIFTETQPGSSKLGWEQALIFRTLPKRYPNDFEILHSQKDILSEKIGILPAIENASGLFEEEGDLDEGFKRLKSIDRTLGKIVYISLTWNTENRFGGGAHTKVGLKEDGKRLLDFLHQQRIAVDLSHTSDNLGYDILNHIERYQLEIPVMASHSNFRAVTNVPRNLPDELAKEILKRHGLIGLNFYREFVGPENPLNFAKHLNHLLKLKGEKNYCFGADFFCVNDFPELQKKLPDGQFFPELENSSSYGRMIKLWKEHLYLPDPLIEQIAHLNLQEFLRTQILNKVDSSQ
jgi:membrane dipeptidase